MSRITRNVVLYRGTFFRFLSSSQYVTLRVVHRTTYVMSDGRNLCYLVAFILAAGFLIWGFIELLKKPQAGESTTNAISRQLRGLGFIILSQVILIAGMSLCFSLGGGKADLKSLFGM